MRHRFSQRGQRESENSQASKCVLAESPHAGRSPALSDCRVPRYSLLTGTFNSARRRHIASAMTAQLFLTCCLRRTLICIIVRIDLNFNFGHFPAVDVRYFLLLPFCSACCMQGQADSLHEFIERAVQPHFLLDLPFSDAVQHLKVWINPSQYHQTI